MRRRAGGDPLAHLGERPWCLRSLDYLLRNWAASLHADANTLKHVRGAVKRTGPTF